jgi:hypothetical protein
MKRYAIGEEHLLYEDMKKLMDAVSEVCAWRLYEVINAKSRDGTLLLKDMTKLNEVYRELK